MCLSENFYPCLLALRIHVLSDFDFRNDASFALFLIMFQSTEYGHPERASFQKFETFGLEQTFWAEIFRGIWGIFGRTISSHFGTEFLVHVFNYSTIISKTK